MTFLINYVDSAVSYNSAPSNYIPVDLISDYLIWTAGDLVVKDLMTSEPTSDELNAAATVISDIAPTTVALCLLQDYSHNIGGPYYTHKVLGMSENKAYVFCFSFDGPTATIPRLEAWDTSAHTTSTKHVLGAGTPANSFVKAVKTTGGTLPGASWVGTALAGAANYVELDTAALTVAKDLYSNIKIVIPQSYATPAAENFVLTVRYTRL
jgi:hypothetical protein